MNRLPYFATHDQEHYRQIIVSTIITQEWGETGKHIPEDVMMVSDEWASLSKVKNWNGAPGGFKWQELTLLELKKPVSIAHMLNHFYPGIEEVSLIPEGDNRIKEARTLGNILSEAEHSYVAERDSRQIHVYAIRDATCIRNDEGFNVNPVDYIRFR
jgi:hypothetical protein